jgi:hypothetical protein
MPKPNLEVLARLRERLEEAKQARRSLRLTNPHEYQLVQAALGLLSDTLKFHQRTDHHGH